MRRVLLTLIAAAALSSAETNSPGQTAAGSKSGPHIMPASKVAARSVSGNTSAAVDPAVMTLHGLCDRPASAGPCKRVVTRKQLDTIIENLRATGQPVSPAMRRNIAQGYADLMIYSQAARRAGVDKDPRFQQILEFARMRALTDLYRMHMAEQAMQVSAAEVGNYYRNNLGKFEELHLRRVSLPRNNPANLKDEDYAAKSRHVADEVRERAARGEDLDQLQKEACDRLAMGKPPATGMAPIRRGMYRAEEEAALFALKPGDVSPVIEEPSVYIVFKLESRKTPTLDEVKGEIQAKLQDEKLETLKNAVTNSVKVEFDDQYLGPAPPHPGWVPLGPPPGEQGSVRKTSPR